MKKIFIIAFIFTSFLYAQSFEQWKNEQSASFGLYKKTMDEEFSSMLKEKWSIYKPKEEKKLFIEPKLKEIPKIKEEVEILKQEINKSPIVKPKKYPTIQAEEIVEIKDMPKIVLDKSLENISFLFFGKQINLNYDKKINFELYEINNKTISNKWTHLSQAKTNLLIKDIKTYVDNLELNDWAKYLFINEIGKNIYKDKNKTNIFTWYILSKMGYDIKVGYNTNAIYLLSTIKHKLFQVSFFNLSNKRYYVLSPEGKSKRVTQLHIYKGNYPKSIESLSFEINKAIKFDNNIQTKNLSFDFQNKKYNIKANYSKDLVDFYRSFPQSDYKIYFNSKNSSLISQTLLKELSKELEGKTEIEAVNFLLRFTQKSFSYKTDDEQFSYEKVMFPEETLFYPFSDCEDRSIMFSTLIKNLLNLNVVGVKFSDHLATAVEFKGKVSGDSFEYKGKTYTISDATYVNANAGMTMPKYKNSSFKIIE